MDEYNAGRFAEAREQADDVRRSAETGALRAGAAYLAGLAAYQLGDEPAAQSDLAAAAETGLEPAAGRAHAALGLILVGRDRPDEAAPHFAAASRSLSGEDARKAAAHAAMAYDRAGDPRASGSWWQVARTSRAGETRPAGLFTLQAGAYRDRAHAEQAAEKLAPALQRLGLGPVNIVPTRDGHRGRLYLVQFGRFKSRAEATLARSELGRLEIIVVMK